VLSGGAIARVEASQLRSLVVTDSIMASEAMRQSKRVRSVTIAPLIGEAMRRISEESSVSSLFD
jgi:ribose-phosphate pyrophosphokinase